MPAIHVKFGEIESIDQLALRNGIGWRKCFEVLHALDRDPVFELTWYESEEGTSVRVDLKE